MGLLNSAQAALAGALSLARTRLELFGTELQVETARLFLALLCAVIVLLLGALATAFAALALMIWLGQENPALAAALIALAFFALAAVAAWSMRRLIRARPRAFDASLTELERDYAALKP
jgi:uncharacterized membrane protein YqjE